MSRWHKVELTLCAPGDDREIDLILNVLPGYAPITNRAPENCDPGAAPELDILEGTYTDTGAPVPQAVLEELDTDYIVQFLPAA